MVNTGCLCSNLASTGPSHVHIAVSFAAGQQLDPTLTKLPARGDCDHGVLDEGCIRRAILEGTKRANIELGTELAVADIQYVSNDTPRYDLFRYCAYLLAKAVHDGVHFEENS